MGKIAPGKYGSIELTKPIDNGNWLAVCDCGRPPFYTRGRSVVSGDTKTCGCRIGWHPPLGHRFGKFVVIDNSFDIKTDWKRPRPAALCICECKKELKVPIYRIYNKLTTGCQSCNMTTHDSVSGVLSSLYNRYNRQALKRNLTFELSIKEFSLLINANCVYSGHAPSQIAKYKNFELVYNGVDRKNNALGYTASNSVTCCGVCNRAKSGMGYDAWIKWVDGFIGNGK